MTTTLPIEDLKRLLSEKPEVAAPLRGVSDPDEAAGVLARVAADHGIAVEAAAIAAALRERLASAPPALSDAELDRVAGGLTREEGIILSVLTFGLGCAVASFSALDNPYATCNEILPP